MIDIEKTSLVVVDVQGKLAGLMYEKEGLFANVEVLIKIAKALGIPIIWCEQSPKALGATIPQLADLLVDNEPIAKFCFSCCGEGKFDQELKAAGGREVILCGIETHICIYQTAMDLLDKDHNVHVIADAVSSRTRQNKEIAIERLRKEGASISSVEMILFELLKTSKHEKFRELAKLIK